MLRVIRRVVGLGAVSVLLALAPGSATAQAPEGPRLSFVKLGPRPYPVTVMTLDQAGAQPHVLIRAFQRTRPFPLAVEGPAWFSDGSAFAFTGLTGSLWEGSGPGGMRIFVMDAEGGPPRPVAGTEGGQAPVVSPDGRTLAFARARERTRVERRPGEYIEHVERNVSIWLVDIASGALRRLTTNRYGVEQFPTSFSPDGSVLAVTSVVQKKATPRAFRRTRPPSVLALRLDGNGSETILRGASSAVFSPDGSRIAYLRQGRKYREREEDGTSTARITDLYVARMDGSGPARLTHSPRNGEAQLSRDPSGQRVAFLQLGRASEFWEDFGAGDALVQINADGTCRTKILSWPNAAIFGPSWQPGPGREAGRISC